MAIADDIQKLEAGRTNTRFSQLLRICQEHFGNPRIKGSHHIFKTPWQGDPRINVQRDGKQAKPYQVDQVVEALQKLEEAQQAKKEALKKSG